MGFGLMLDLTTRSVAKVTMSLEAEKPRLHVCRGENPATLENQRKFIVRNCIIGKPPHACEMKPGLQICFHHTLHLNGHSNRLCPLASPKLQR